MLDWPCHNFIDEAVLTKVASLTWVILITESLKNQNQKLSSSIRTLPSNLKIDSKEALWGQRRHIRAALHISKMLWNVSIIVHLNRSELKRNVLNIALHQGYHMQVIVSHIMSKLKSVCIRQKIRLQSTYIRAPASEEAKKHDDFAETIHG